MRSRVLCSCLMLLLLVPLAVAKDKDKDKDKTQLPKLVVSAQYVFVTTYFGDPSDQPLNIHIMPEDRQAVADVQRAIEKWGKYSIALVRGDADLVIVVRKGRLAETQAGVRAHAGSRLPSNRPNEPAGIADPTNPDTPGAELGDNSRTPSVRPEATADFGDPQDEIAVYSAALGNEANTPPIWRGRRIDGLDPPQMRLIQELRTKVEAAAKAP
jgi:hypothetical protein